MKVIIFYKSIHHGNTKKIVDVMASILGAEVREVVNEVYNVKLEDYDLIGFASGIYGFKHHKEILNLADRSEELENKKIFIVSTNGEGKIRQHKKLRTILISKQVKIIDEFACCGFSDWGPTKFFGGIKKGHPDEVDLKEAEEFARRLILK